MIAIEKDMSTSFKELQDRNDACFATLHSQMEQIVNGSVVAYAAQYFPTQVKEYVHAEIAVFAFDKLKEQMNAHLDALLSTRDLAKGSHLVVAEGNLEDINTRLSELRQHMLNSAIAANKHTDDINANITSLLGFREAMESDVASLKSEYANLREILRVQANDVEKGEKGKHVISKPLPPNKTLEHKTRRAETTAAQIPSTSAATVQIPSSSATQIEDEAAQIARSLTEKERNYADGKLMADMVLSGADLYTIRNFKA